MVSQTDLGEKIKALLHCLFLCQSRRTLQLTMGTFSLLLSSCSLVLAVIGDCVTQSTLSTVQALLTLG